MNLRAQDNPEQGKKVFDNYATVTTMVYPTAGAMFKATGEMLDMFGYFGNVDVVGEAIKHINERLDILEKRVSDLETRMRAFENELLRTQNMSRVRLLRSKQDALKLLVYKLQQKPTEQRDKRALAKEAQIIASGFLEDPDLWMWSDMHEKDGAMLSPDFKPLPALEYYVVALVAWIAAIDSAADGDVEFVKREHGRELQKHITYLTVGPNWKDRDDPVTLPENIRARVSCSLELLTRSPNAITHKCTIHEGCEDQIARVLSTVAIHEEIMPVGKEICNVPFSAKKMASEDELERMYGIDVMEKLAEKLTRLKDYGTVREQFVGTFDPSTQTAQFLYAVKPNGDLLWYMHRVVTRKTGVLSSGPRAPSPTQPAKRHDTKVGNLDPLIRLPVESGTFAKSKITHFLDGPKRVGNGWESFREVMPAGLSGVYALTQDGKLLWYRHDGFIDGSMKWDGPREVGRGWGDFKQIIPMGDGIIYAITNDGILKWYHHNGYLTGAGLERGVLSPGSWEGPKNVGTGWGDFKQVFAGGEGVIYAVTNDGILKWYHHKGYMTGSMEWEGQKNVGTGWQNFKTIFSPGEGVIYAMRPTGELLWYKHDGYKDGSVRWQVPVQVAADWKDFLFVFPRMTGTYTPPVVR
jgi:hypothetical protein